VRLPRGDCSSKHGKIVIIRYVLERMNNVHLNPLDYVVEDSGKPEAGAAWPESAPVTLGYPQVAYAVEMGDGEAEPVHGRSQVQG
jgi:hypothetical protein